MAQRTGVARMDGLLAPGLPCGGVVRHRQPCRRAGHRHGSANVGAGVGGRHPAAAGLCTAHGTGLLSAAARAVGVRRVCRRKSPRRPGQDCIRCVDRRLPRVGAGAAVRPGDAQPSEQGGLSLFRRRDCRLYLAVQACIGPRASRPETTPGCCAGRCSSSARGRRSGQASQNGATTRPDANWRLSVA